MTFEEDFRKDFPSFSKEELKELIILSDISFYELTKRETYERKDEVRYKAMSKTCLDKVRVREAIEKVGKKIGINTEGRFDKNGNPIKSTSACWQCALSKELGIEEK